MSQFPVNAGYALLVRMDGEQWAFCVLTRHRSECNRALATRLESLKSRGASPMDYRIVECCATITLDEAVRVY